MDVIRLGRNANPSIVVAHAVVAVAGYVMLLMAVFRLIAPGPYFFLGS
ncbi:MAG TPA: hypothetical protein VH600_12475 [Burkholderiales bacterium]|jgi:hypothetical protein